MTKIESAESVRTGEGLAPQLHAAEAAIGQITVSDCATRFLIGGMDGAGKSTLSCSVYTALKEQGHQVSLHELDPWSDTHEPILGKKGWESRRKRSGQDLGHELAARIEDFTRDPSEIVIGDLMGRVETDELCLLDGMAQYAVLVTRDRTQKDEQSKYPQTEIAWRRLFRDINIPVALHVHSALNGQAVPTEAIRINSLERRLCPENPGIRQLASKFVDLTAKRYQYTLVHE